MEDVEGHELAKAWERKAPNERVTVPMTSRTRILWLLRTVGWGALLGVGLVVLANQVVQVSQQPADFCQDYAAARRFLEGIPIYPSVHQWAGNTNCSIPLTYDAHPPSSILLFLLLALLPAVPATLIWGACSLASYLGGGWLLLNELGWLSLRTTTLFVIGSVFWVPFVFSEQMLNMGQILFLLLVMAWLLERRGHAGWAGLVLGLAALLKIWPVVLLVGALLQKQWRLTLIGGLTLIIGTALSFVVFGSSAYAVYLGPVRVTENVFVPTDANISLVGMVARIFMGIPPILPPLLSWPHSSEPILLGEVLAVLMLLGVFCAIWWSRRAESESAKLLSQGMLVTTLLLIFPVTWYWMLVILPLACVTTLLALRQMARPPRWWVVLCLVSLAPAMGVGWAVLRLTWWLVELHVLAPQGWVSLLFDLSTISLLFFTGAQMWLLWQVGKGRTQKQSEAGVFQYMSMQEGG